VGRQGDFRTYLARDCGWRKIPLSLIDPALGRRSQPKQLEMHRQGISAGKIPIFSGETCEKALRY
jgi:hypothetical protein